MTDKPQTSVAGSTPPGPNGLPIFGSLLRVRQEPHIAIDRLAKQYGDVFMLKMGSVPTVVISHPKLLREAFNGVELADRWVGEIMDILSNSGMDIALAPYGDHWRRLQRFANRELLSHRNLQNIREKHVEEVVNWLVDQVGEASDSGQLIAPVDLISRSNLMIMFRSVFGRGGSDTREFESRREDLLSIITWVFQNASAANPADYIPLMKILPNSTIKAARTQAIRQYENIEFLIDSVDANGNKDLDNPSCLVDVMLAKEAEGEIDRESIVRLIEDLFAAGTDTSAQTITWLLLSLANRPEIQGNVHEELDRVIGQEGMPAFEDQGRLPYLKATILENMRFHTVAPFGVPHKARESCDVGGYTIPEGAQVLGNIYTIHHDPRFWDSPEEFKPERFMSADGDGPTQGIANEAFMPFGVGRRGCPGQSFGEMVIWLHASRLLHKFRFSVPAEAGTDSISEEGVFGLTLATKPFKLKVDRR